MSSSYLHVFLCLTNLYLFSIQDTILNCIHANRLHWKNLCLQDLYNLEQLNNVNPQSNLHKVPFNSFIGGPPLPEKFATRDCYPVQSDLFKRQVSDRLNQLKLFTNLNYPANRVCYVYDDFMLKHENIHER